MDARYWKKYFDKKAVLGKNFYKKSDYGEKESFLQRYNQIAQILNDIKIPKDEWILDVGCGVGNYIGLLSNNELKVGVDISLQALKIAKQRAKSCIFIAGDITKLPIANEKISLVLCIEVLQYLSDSSCKNALNEIDRILKKGGDLILSTLNREYILCKLGILKQRNKVNPQKKSILKHYLEQLGFEIQKEINLPGTVRFTKFAHSVFNWLHLTPPELLSYSFILWARKY